MLLIVFLERNVFGNKSVINTTFYAIVCIQQRLMTCSGLGLPLWTAWNVIERPQAEMRTCNWKKLISFRYCSPAG